MTSMAVLIAQNRAVLQPLATVPLLLPTLPTVFRNGKTTTYSLLLLADATLMHKLSWLPQHLLPMLGHGYTSTMAITLVLGWCFSRNIFPAPPKALLVLVTIFVQSESLRTNFLSSVTLLMTSTSSSLPSMALVLPFMNSLRQFAQGTLFFSLMSNLTSLLILKFSCNVTNANNSCSPPLLTLLAALKVLTMGRNSPSLIRPPSTAITYFLMTTIKVPNAPCLCANIVLHGVTW